MSPRCLVPLALAIVAACSTEAPEAPPATAEALVEVDHVYVVVPQPRDAALTLLAAGVVVDTTGVMVHEGSGTASLSAMFDNAYLELLWVDPRSAPENPSEEFLAEMRDLESASTWSLETPSPFGIGLRRTANAPDSLPFQGESVEGGDWVEPGESFFMFETDDRAPATFVVPPYMATPSWIGGFRESQPELFQHERGLTTLTGVRISGVEAPPAVTEAEIENLAFADPDGPHLLELTFDGGAAGVTLDLRPDLPLVIRH
jgi:hypothetical protein